MKKNLTELVFVIDMSGSMHGLEADTIGGFNTLIEKQKKEEGDCLVTTFLFNNETYMLHDRVSLKKIKEMKDNNYFPASSTALLDAIGDAVNHISMVHHYIRKEDVPEKTIIAIMTDGYENSSKHFTYNQINKLITNKKEKNNWEFVFLGANIDVAKESSKLGIDNSIRYETTKEGVKDCYESVSCCVSNIRNKK